MSQKRLKPFLSALGALALVGQMIVLPVIIGLLSGGLSEIVFGFVYCHFLATLFGVHILFWNIIALSTFACGVWLTKCPPLQSGPDAKQGLGLFLTMVPVIIFTLLLVFGEGHGV
jgi:hypothetical protein